MKRLLLLIPLAVALSGCGIEKYDNFVAECDVNDGKTEITMYVYRDSGSTQRDVVPASFTKACADLRADKQWTDNSVDLP